MTWTTWPRSAASVASVMLALAGAGCGALDVSDPTAIEDEELDNAAGAELLRADALGSLFTAMAAGASASAVLSDEFFADPPSWYQLYGLVSTDEMLDRRESARFEQVEREYGQTVYGQWHEARRAATVAMAKLHEFSGLAGVGEMLAVRGFATLRLAEDICPGFPLHEITGYKPVYGAPLTTDEAFERALADFDSAVVYAADSARILAFARVGRARTLLGLGRFAEARAAAQPVATDYVHHGEYNLSPAQPRNPLSFVHYGDDLRSVADQEGGVGLDFITAADPRVETDSAGIAGDGVTTLYASLKYPDESAPIVLASGIEARLIEAEAALNAGDDAWLTILNELRATQITPALSALADPGTAEARVDLLFRERALWLFLTGHRLADLRRLIRHYGRSGESVFATGPYRLGGGFGTATSIPFPAELETPYSPAVTGCTSR